MAVEIGGYVLAGTCKERDQSVIENKFPEFSAAGDFIHVREDDMGGSERACAGVGFLNELALVSGVHDKHAGFDRKFIEGFLQMSDVFSCEGHSRDVEIEIGVLADFFEFAMSSHELDAKRLAKHGKGFAGIWFIGLEFHDAGLTSAQKNIRGELFAECGSGSRAR